MNEILVAWYFLIWSFGGLHYAVIGPFSTESQCEEQRKEITQDAGNRNQVSKKCWYGPGRGIGGER